jgi:Zn-dependent M28 family amino/carboxypeptidase
MRPRSLAALALVAIVATSCGEPAPPTPRPPDARTVAAAITEDGLRARLEALAAATTGSDRYRAVGSAGYERAAALVEQEVRAAGWTVTDDAYTGLAFVDDGGSSLEVGGRTFGVDDLRPLIFAPAGDVSGPVVTLDPGLDFPADTAKGCTATHYGTLPPDAIVVVRQGPCLRRDQVLAAQQAGAAAFVAVYPQMPAGVLYRPTLIEPRLLEIPAASVSRKLADALLAAAADRAEAHLVTHGRTTSTPTRSILAELPGTDPGAVIMLGAHLDSVIEGPGINDDGSGVAALLEIARALGGTRPRATIRLAFWSGEELGLHGSVRYASALSTEDARSILVYVNVDMIASPNGFAGVYDEPGAPAGSAAARALLTAAVERAGGTPVGVDLGGESDHYGFAQAGVATAGVYAGAVEPVSAEQAAASGAVAGRPADACYHQPCDDVANANLVLARILAAGLADFTVRVANNPELLRH